MKNTLSHLKPIKLGKRPRTTYCLGCKDFTHNFRPQEVKMTNKVLRKISNYFTHNFRPQEVKMTNKVLRKKSNCMVCRSNKSRFSKQNAATKNSFFNLQKHAYIL